MIRAGAVLVVFVALMSVSGWSAAQTQDILVANNSEIAFIDANDNGMRDSDDCFLSASILSNGQGLTIVGQQESGPDQLRVCSGNCYGSGLASSDFVEASLDSCDYAGGPFVPMFADFCDGPECTSSEGHSAGVGQTAGVTPITLRSGAIFRNFFGPQLAGSGVVCSAGGPAVQAVDFDGNTVLRDLVPYPSTGTPTHMCVNNLPVQLLSGPIVFRLACFPVAGGVSAIALSGSPEAPFALIDFGNLAPCAGRASRAPTVSEWGLIGLMLSLLLGGTWLLSRRQRFAAALPLA